MKPTVFDSITVGTPAEAILRILGAPERCLNPASGQRWFYGNGRVELVFSGRDRLTVEKVIFRPAPPPGGEGPAAAGEPAGKL